jgi:hypothetical protein
VPDTSQLVNKAEATTAFAASGIQINGGMEVDQPNAGTAYGINAGAANGHLIDSFRYDKSGTSVLTAQQVNSSIPNYTKSLKLTVSTAQAAIGADVVDLLHLIEGFRISPLGWGTASALPLTLGMWIKSSVAGIIPVLIRNHDGSASVTVNTPALVANTATWVVLNYAAQTTGVWKSDNTVGLNIRIRVASVAGMNLVATNGSTIEITGLVILPNTLTITAAQSPLLMRPYDVELQLCQRYYGRYDFPTGVVFGYTAPSGGANCFGYFAFNTRMRAVPTIAAAPSGSNATAPSYQPAMDCCRIDFTSGGAGLFYQSFNILIADARL